MCNPLSACIFLLVCSISAVIIIKYIVYRYLNVSSQNCNTCDFFSLAKLAIASDHTVLKYNLWSVITCPNIQIKVLYKDGGSQTVGRAFTNS